MKAEHVYNIVVVLKGSAAPDGYKSMGSLTVRPDLEKTLPAIRAGIQSRIADMQLPDGLTADDVDFYVKKERVEEPVIVADICYKQAIEVHKDDTFKGKNQQ